MSASATVEHGFTEVRIRCDSRPTAEALASAMLGALEAVAGDVQGARMAARSLKSMGATVYIRKSGRVAYAAARDALAIAIDMDPSLPMVTL